MKHEIEMMLKRQGPMLWLTIEEWFNATQTVWMRTPDH